MTERLGFNDTLLLLALGGIAAFALGALLGTDTAHPGVTGYMDATDPDGKDGIKNLRTTGVLLKDLGMIAVGTAIILAAVRAEGHSTTIRAVMIVVGLAVLFKMLSFGFGGSIGA